MTTFQFMPSWPPISRDQLRFAATTAGFDTVFPLLVRRLIVETASGLTEIDMPGGSGVAAGGFDGVVAATGSTAFVPDGCSVWELSVGGGQAKAEDDYAKRTEAPPGRTLQDVTYVAALLVPWVKARAWARSSTEEGRWHAVLGYNLDRIHAWLDTAPATTTWLAGQLGKSFTGARAVDSWWGDVWLTSTRIPLVSPIVLAGREPASEQLHSRLADGTKLVTLGGHLREEEALAFVAATLERAGGLVASQLGARALYVTDQDALNQLLSSQQPLVLVLSDISLARNITSAHSHQLIAVALPGGQADVEVPRLHSQVLTELLQGAGLEFDEASKLARLGRRSLLALRRGLAHHPELYTPAWARSTSTAQRRLLLLGGWDDSRAEDRDVVEALVGGSYTTIVDAASELANTSDMPFIARLEALWHLPAVEDAWTLLGHSLTSDDLLALKTACLQVFGELDPALDLPSETRWQSGMLGLRRRFSSTLRAGLAKSLIQLSMVSTLSAAGSLSPALWVDDLVAELLQPAEHDETFKTWSSLSGELQLLAEASPKSMLSALARGLGGDPPLLRLMFQDSKDSGGGAASLFASNSVHSNFLWALELLAWSRDHFDEAVEVLIALAILDPGGRLSNRPHASLVEIFSSWSPNTTASLDDRKEGLSRIAQNQPDFAIGLLHDLIPDGRGFQSVHPGPEFRDWKRTQQPNNGEIAQMVGHVVGLQLSLLTTPAHYVQMLSKLGALPPAQREQFISMLSTASGSIDAEADRELLFGELTEMIRHHREYSDSFWALPDETLERLNVIAELVQPTSIKSRVAWLFDSDFVELGDMRRRDDFEMYEREVLGRRASAIGMILNEGGTAGVLGFAADVKFPYLVGVALASQPENLDAECVSWLKGEGQPQREVGSAYVGQRLRNSPELLPAMLGVAEGPLARSRVLRLAAKPQLAWERLDQEEPEVLEHYWREFTYWGLGTDFAGALQASWSLLEAGRAAAALDLTMLYLRGDSSVELAELIAASLERLLEQQLADPEFPRLREHSFEQLFLILAPHRDVLGKQRVVSLEWQFLPALGFDPHAPTIHRALIEEPEFFVELVSLCFRPDSEQEPDIPEQDRERRRQLIYRAHDALRSLRLCPGVLEDGSLDSVALDSWVSGSRTAFANVDRTSSGDVQIGEVLAKAPPSAEGCPLPQAVCELLERLRNENIETGLAIGIRNKRSTTTRGLLEGGSQEWAIAKTLRVSAEGVRQFPRARRLLIKIAESYEQDARREDREAERRHQGLGW